MSKNRNRMTKAEYLNMESYRVLFDHYKTIALNAFKWSGLPDTITERHLERGLFEKGKMLFFRDPGLGLMCLPAFNGSQLDVYSEPLRWRATGLGYNREFPREKCVLIENNKLRVPTEQTVSYFVRKIHEADRTADTNLTTCKVPWIIVTDERNVLTYKEIIRKVDENEVAVLGNKGLSLDAIQLFPTKPTFIGNDLIDYQNSLESKLLTFLGIDNCPIDKKERLISDEAQSNDELISINADNMLEARKRACEQINEMFGLNVTVELRHKPKEGEVNEPIPGRNDQKNA